MILLLSFALFAGLLNSVALAQSSAPRPSLGLGSRTPAPGNDLLGEWEGHMTDGDGSNPGQRRMNISLTITPDRITAGGHGNMMGDGTYRISGSGSKRRIDATGTSGQYQGKKYEGIFTVEGDTLKWCAGNPGKGRPNAFRTNTGSGYFLMVLKRKS